jgi:hypothetical protein
VRNCTLAFILTSGRQLTLFGDLLLAPLGPNLCNCDSAFGRSSSHLFCRTHSEGTPTKAVIVKLHEQDENFEHILESAVIVSWADLMRGRSGLIHIEYGFAPSATLDYLKVWSSSGEAIGFWLVRTGCQLHNLMTSASTSITDMYWRRLAHILEVVMQHQSLFALPQNLGRQGLLQIGTPTEKESNAAAASVNDAIDRVNSLAEPTAETA